MPARQTSRAGTKVGFSDLVIGGALLDNRLAEIRHQRGLTQEELAEGLEVSRHTISSIENGKYNPSILLAFKIARFFQMTIEQIFIYREQEGNKNAK